MQSLVVFLTGHVVDQLPVKAQTHTQRVAARQKSVVEAATVAEAATTWIARQ